MKAGGRENGSTATCGGASCAGRTYYPPILINMDDLDPRMPGALRLVRKWCPELSEEKLAEAAQNFLAYMDVVRRIYERVTAEKTINLVDTASDAVEPQNR